MSTCVPQHVVCDWYTPDFTPGPTPCTLQSFDERRSRLGVVGVFFRSKNVGPRNNNIKVECVWITNNLDGSFQPIGTIVGTTDEMAVQSVWLKVFNGSVMVEEWFVAQNFVSEGVDPDPDVWISAIPSLKSRINSEPTSLIEMNITDVQQPWPVFDEEEPPAQILPLFLGTFPITSMSGATGGPADPNSHTPKLRTGPAQSIILIGNSEINNADGSMSILNATRYWNGACWLRFDPNAPDCADPNNPQGCDQDPSTKCPV